MKKTISALLVLGSVMSVSASELIAVDGSVEVQAVAPKTVTAVGISSRDINKYDFTVRLKQDNTKERLVVNCDSTADENRSFLTWVKDEERPLKDETYGTTGKFYFENEVQCKQIMDSVVKHLESAATAKASFELDYKTHTVGKVKKL